MRINHYDLFAGIGGFSLALEEVFGEETIEHIFCEWEQFPSSVLRNHWPDGRFYGDITDLIADTAGEGFQGELHGHSENAGGSKEKTLAWRRATGDVVTIVTGGFPCQPFSAAGRRRGTADDRYQWPNMFEVIRNVKPEWVIAENVRGLVTWNEGMVLEQVCTDLESQGYEVQPFIIPAVAVNAPHRRDRVWIIAHSAGERSISGMGLERKSDEETTESRSQDTNAADTRREYPDWDRDWREVAFTTCNDGVDDGLPREVDGVPYSRPRWRKDSLKAYGNAIVPQVAMEIFRAMKTTINGG